MLKNELKCDYVICLSHLGYKYNNNKISDHVLAENTSNIDLILGGHTHTFLDEPTRLKNKEGQAVLINQAGWAGIVLGRIDVFFEKGKTSDIQTQHAKKLRMQLAAIHTAQDIDDINLPGFSLHLLKGDRSNIWSISVNGNWRVTFEFTDGNAYILNYEDYH
jgi:proteic killer suppression protein